MLFGRAAEMAEGEAALRRAREGAGGVLLLTGPPGIGKSTLARALLTRAEQDGARVGVGRAWEVGGAPAYWPWSQALAELGVELDELLGRASGEMAAAERLVAFDRIAKRLVRETKDAPVVVLLDDVHAADVASLELALAVARTVQRQRLLLLLTTRESELRLAPQHDELVAKLAREGTRVTLGRLADEAIGEWLAAVRYSGDVSRVCQISEGNPLFVEEAVRVGVSDFARAAGGGVATIVREHVDRASASTRHALAMAAVLGREADVDDLAALVGVSHDEIAAAEAEGLRVGILQSAERRRLVFSHVLLRDALYESLPPSERSALHVRAASVLADRSASPALVASHLLAAGAEAPPRRLASAVAEAARLALRTHASDGAALLIEQAKEALRGRSDAESDLILDLVVAELKMGSGASNEGRAIAERCADQARQLGRHEEQGRAALVYALELMSGQRDATMVRLLEEALIAVPAGDGALRARLMSRLGAALVPPRSEEEMERAHALALDAVAMARRIGDQAELLVVVRHAASAIGYTLDAATRHGLMVELVELARAQRDDFTRINVGGFFVVQLFEVGQPTLARAQADEYVAFIEALPLPHVHWRAAAMRASVAALEGRFEDARRHGAELHRLARTANARPAILAWALLQLSLALCDDDAMALRESDTELMALLGAIPPMAPWVALLHALHGRAADARRALAPVVAMPRGFPWLVAAGLVAVVLEDRDLARLFYPLLQAEGFAGRFFWGPAGVFPLGPTSRILAELARIDGRAADARRHFDEAIAHCRAAGAVSLLELSQRGAARVGAGAEGVAPAEAGPVAAPESRRPRAITLAREGDVWLVVASDGAPFRVKHSKGLEYLDTLLRSPGREHYALALAGGGEGAEDAGAWLDERAKAAYRERVSDVEEELADAERVGDTSRAERARRERDAIAAELARAVGLGGRDRKAASNVERARINVQRRIKDALRRIAEHDADLGRYLEATVKTGAYCVYEPV